MSIQTQWNFSLLFPNDIEKESKELRLKVHKAHDAFVNHWKKNKEFTTNPKILRQALDEYELLCREYAPGNKDEYYYWLSSELDSTNAAIKGKLQHIEDDNQKLQDKLRFFLQRLTKIKPAQQKIFLKSPELEKYRHFLEITFTEAKHILSEKEERLISKYVPLALSNWVRMVNSLLAKEERAIQTEKGKVTKNFNELVATLDDPHKPTRDSAAKAVNEVFLEHQYVAEQEVNSVLTYKKTIDELRHFKRPDQMRHMSDDIETEVVDAMLAAVESRYSLAHEHYKLKAKLLGLPVLQYHERNVEVGKVTKQYSFEHAHKLVHRVLKRLDPEFGSIFQMYVEKGHIDVFPKKGKVGGAFCAHNLLYQPTFILMNFAGKLNDVSTLAHEVGHGINNELMKQKQNALNFDSPTSTAEVASTFMEDFVVEELMKEANEEERLALMVSKLDRDISTIFRQVAGYRFEQDLHREFRKKGYLSAKEIGDLFQTHMASYMGPAVEQSQGSENWWIYWTHFRSFFYVYSYASGQLISKSLQHMVKENPKEITRVKEFLSAGMSASPKDIFNKLGIDITNPSFWNEGMDEIETSIKTIQMLDIKAS